MTLHKINHDEIKRMIVKKGSSTFKLNHIEVLDKKINSSLKIGYDKCTPFKVNLEPSERIVSLAAHIDSNK